MRYADSHCVYSESFDAGRGHRYTFTGKCVVTGKEVSVTVPAKELGAYRHEGKHIQDAMPSLTDGEREFLMSGISDEGWARVFPECEEEPEYSPEIG